jgi:hypothetical protein
MEKQTNSNDYFSKEEIEEFKKGDSLFPNFIYDESFDKIKEVMEIVALSGIVKGVPTEISIYHHKKGQTTKRLTYKLKK